MTTGHRLSVGWPPEEEEGDPLPAGVAYIPALVVPRCGI